MDAKAGDWVVTPRHGKPVEINRAMARRVDAGRGTGRDLLGEFVTDFRDEAEQVKNSFRAKFVVNAR